MSLPLEGDVAPPNLSAVPDGDQMAREYPPLALDLNLAGSATITCTTTAEWRLTNCRVDQEMPAGLGFGAAALRLSAYFSMSPGKMDGRAVEGDVTIPIRFQPERNAHPGSTPPPIPPPPTSPAALDLARQVVAIENVAADLHRNYQPFLDQMSARLATDGNAKASATTLDAFRSGLADAVAEEVDWRSHVIASTMTAEQLRATLAYLESPAGVAWRRAADQIDAPRRPKLDDRVRRDARHRLCQLETCDASGAPTSAP